MLLTNSNFLNFTYKSVDITYKFVNFNCKAVKITNKSKNVNCKIMKVDYIFFQIKTMMLVKNLLQNDKFNC